MKRFNIHWSARWIIRIGYIVFILFLFTYLGIGFFLKSHLAEDLLVKQLSRQAGRPVHVGSVSLDWVHGFHVVLKNVEVPSLTGKPSPIACKSMVATIEIWPFLTKREIIFRHISLKDGCLRLRRNAAGEWRGVFPVPVTAPPRKPVIRRPKKTKRKFVLFFPRVSLKRITVELVLETSKGPMTYKMFLNRAETFGSPKTEKVRGEAVGSLQLCHHPALIQFRIRGTYALMDPFPFNLSVTISRLPLEALNVLCRSQPRWRLHGNSRIFLKASGSLAHAFTFQGQMVMRRPRFSSPGCDITLNQETSVFQLRGTGKQMGESSPKLVFTVTSSYQNAGVPFHRKGHWTSLGVGVFRNIRLQGTTSLASHHITALVACDYQIGTHTSEQQSGHLRASGVWNGGEPSRFRVKLSLSRFPLYSLIDGIKKQSPHERAFLSTEPISSSPGLPRFLDRLQGEIQGQVSQGHLTSLSSRIGLTWGKSHMGLRITPYHPQSRQPMVCQVKITHLSSETIQAVPSLLSSTPPVIRSWCQAFRGGEIASLSCDLKIRALGQITRNVSVDRAEMQLDRISMALPSTSLVLKNVSGNLFYKVPSLKVIAFQGNLNDICHVQIKKLLIRDVFSRPLDLSGEGTIDASGIRLESPSISSLWPTSLHLPTGGASRVTPTFFSGNVHLRFDGTLFPFHARDYEAVLKDVLIKGIWDHQGKTQIPLTLTLSATTRPGDMEMTHASLVTPLGQMIARGTAKISPSGTWRLSITSHGQIMPEGMSLPSFSRWPRSLRITGVAPFALKINGPWPHLLLEGTLDGKDLFCSYKDLFVKDSGVPVSLGLQIHQTGPHACRIDWIRGNIKGFILTFRGNLTSWKPLRGKITCETDTHQIKNLLSFFPRYCRDKQCLIGKGDIQCHGWIKLDETPSYEITSVLANLFLPFPGSLEPLMIGSAHALVSRDRCLLDIGNIVFKESFAPRILIDGNRKEGQWFWKTRLKCGYLDLDDILSTLQHGNSQKKKDEMADKEKQPGKDPFAFLISHLHDQFIEGSLSVQKLKILDDLLYEVFTRFRHSGREGRIVGFNFLTRPKGYGAIDVFWKETKEGTITLQLLPLVKNLDFGKILDGLLHRKSPFRGYLSFHGTLNTRGHHYQTLKGDLNGSLNVTFKNGIMTHWAVLTSIFQLLDLYDILTLKDLPGISRNGLEYNTIHGTIQVNHGIAKTEDAYLKSRPFFMSGEGTLDLHDGQVSLLIGVYPFKVLDSLVSHIPIIGRIFTNKDKKFIGYFFQAKGPVTHPHVTSINVERLGKRIWNTFRKILSLPLYPFQDHPNKEEKP